MPPPDMSNRRCQWVGQVEALKHFAVYGGRTQSQQHIKPLHWYVACRLALEGGFHPDDLKPRPPFSVTRRRGQNLIHFDPSTATGGEATVFGGLKTKSVDVVATKPQLGPVLAVSCKGMTGAFRNLTNRMEETIGECTNLHITYPALVFGFLFVIRANQASVLIAANDIAITRNHEPVEAIIRFHSALRELAGRRGIRDDISRYEAVSLALVNVRQGAAGRLLTGFPYADSPLHIEKFFATLYQRYDERFVYGAPNLKSVTQRMEWSPESPALVEHVDHLLGYEARVAST